MKLLRLQNDFTLQMLMDAQHAARKLIVDDGNAEQNTSFAGVFCSALPDCKPLWETV